MNPTRVHWEGQKYREIERPSPPFDPSSCSAHVAHRPLALHLQREMKIGVALEDLSVKAYLIMLMRIALSGDGERFVAERE